MSVNAVLIAGQVAWEVFLIVILSAILATIYQVGTEQWQRIRK
jgi:hypothetical protein